MVFWRNLVIDERIQSRKDLGMYRFRVEYLGPVPDVAGYNPEDEGGRRVFEVPVYHYQLLSGLHVVVSEHPEQTGRLWLPPGSFYKETNDLECIELSRQPKVVLDEFLHLSGLPAEKGKIESTYIYKTNRGDVEITLVSGKASTQVNSPEGPDENSGLFDEITKIRWATVENNGMGEVELFRLVGEYISHLRPAEALSYRFEFLNGDTISMMYAGSLEGREFNLAMGGSDDSHNRIEINPEKLRQMGVTSPLPEKIRRAQLRRLVSSIISDISLKGTIKNPIEYIQNSV